MEHHETDNEEVAFKTSYCKDVNFNVKTGAIVKELKGLGNGAVLSKLIATTTDVRVPSFSNISCIALKICPYNVIMEGLTQNLRSCV